MKPVIIVIAPSTTGKKADVHKTRILIVDDHPMFRQGIRQLLERSQDFDIVGEASNGEEAIALASSAAPDVIVMDIGMPKVLKSTDWKPPDA
jgi:DNA-binding NarL/FixJ family response regulator